MNYHIFDTRNGVGSETEKQRGICLKRAGEFFLDNWYYKYSHKKEYLFSQKL